MLEYLKKQIRSYVFLVFFLATVLLNYLPDIAPYYMQLMSGGEGKVIGTLYSFSESCTEPQEGDWLCRAQYRIPFEKIKGREAIGLGVVVNSTEISCSADPSKKVVLVPRGNDGVTFNSLRSYISFTLARINCESDLLVRIWARPTNGRYGFIQAPAFVGSEVAVSKCKKIVEYAISGVLTSSLAIFVLFYVVFGFLSRITGLNLEFPPFGRFKYYWLSFIVATSGVLFEILLPVNFPLNVTTKISNFLGLMVISGPVLDFVTHSDSVGSWSKRIGKFLVRSRSLGMWPLVGLNVGLVATSYFIYIYPHCVLFWSFVCLGYAIAPFNAMMFFFGVSILSDSLKIFMVPYLPGSRLTITYIVFIFLFELRKRISALEEQARFEAGTEIALSVAHDLRSPLTALRTVLSGLSGDSAELARESIARIRGIAESLLSSARGNVARASSISTVSLNSLVSSTITEFKIRFPNRVSTIIFRTETEDLFSRVDAIEFQRIITNLLNNSVEATSPSDLINIQTKRIGTKAIIVIRDYGVGISDEIIKSLGVMKTTGKEGHAPGFGLGLAHAKKSIHRWGGGLNIRSVAGMGCEVEIWLPSGE